MRTLEAWGANPTQATIALRRAVAADVEERTLWLVLRDTYLDAGCDAHTARTLAYLDVLPYWRSLQSETAVNAMNAQDERAVSLHASLMLEAGVVGPTPRFVIINDPLGPQLAYSREPDIGPDWGGTEDRPLGNGRRWVRPPNLSPRVVCVGAAWVCRWLRLWDRREQEYTIAGLNREARRFDGDRRRPRRYRG